MNNDEIITKVISELSEPTFKYLKTLSIKAIREQEELSKTNIRGISYIGITITDPDKSSGYIVSAHPDIKPKVDIIKTIKHKFVNDINVIRQTLVSIGKNLGRPCLRLVISKHFPNVVGSDYNPFNNSSNYVLSDPLSKEELEEANKIYDNIKDLIEFYLSTKLIY